MAQKPKGPFEVRGRWKGDPNERLLGSHNDLDSAKTQADGEHSSEHYDQVTVVDQPTQACLIHLPVTEDTEHDGVQEPAH